MFSQGYIMLFFLYMMVLSTTVQSAFLPVVQSGDMTLDMLVKRHDQVDNKFSKVVDEHVSNDHVFGNWKKPWLPTFDPLGDISRVNESFMANPSHREKFYDFTAENIKESRVSEWYAAWSIERQNSSSRQDHGEWEEFAREFMGASNFMCTLGNPACLGISSLHEIEERYPEHPTFVRRIYFVLHMYSLWHDQAITVLDAYDAAQLALIANVGDLTHAMELEPDRRAAALCSLLHELIDIGVQLAFSAASSMSQGIGILISEHSVKWGAIFEKLFKGSEKAAQFATFAAANPDAVPLAVIDNIGAKLDANFREYCDQPGNPCGGPLPALTGFNLITSNRFGKANQLLLNWFRSSKDYGTGMYRPKSPWEGIHVSGGRGTDPLCTPFQGDLAIDADGNIAEMTIGLTNKFHEMREILTAHYETYYNGTPSKPGKMSLTAEVITWRKWAGEGSLTKDLHTTREWQEDLELQMAMQVASVVSTADHSHILCTHAKNAMQTCANAAKADKPCITGQKDCLRTVFCPEPMTDPSLICKAQKWYPSDGPGAHMTILPSAEKWEGLMANRYKLTRQKVLHSAWAFYRAYGNDFQSIQASWGTKSDNVSNIAGGFHLPVCVSEKIGLFSNDYPALCGAWNSNETYEFISAFKMNPEDQGEKPNDLINNILPITIEKYTSSSPVARFLAYCENGIRYPRKKSAGNKHPADKEDPVRLYRAHRHRDPACNIVKETTSTMNEELANKWFCDFGKDEHKVFSYEADYITVDTVPVKFPPNHKQKCKEWKHGNRRKSKEDCSNCTSIL